MDELMRWYNEVKPLLSLRFEDLDTPAKAFYRKLPPERTWGYAASWMMEEVSV